LNPFLISSKIGTFPLGLGLFFRCSRVRLQAGSLSIVVFGGVSVQDARRWKHLPFLSVKFLATMLGVFWVTPPAHGKNLPAPPAPCRRFHRLSNSQLSNGDHDKNKLMVSLNCFPDLGVDLFHLFNLSNPSPPSRFHSFHNSL